MTFAPHGQYQGYQPCSLYFPQSKDHPTSPRYSLSRREDVFTWKSVFWLRRIISIVCGTINMNKRTQLDPVPSKPLSFQIIPLIKQFNGFSLLVLDLLCNDRNFWLFSILSELITLLNSLIY